MRTYEPFPRSLLSSSRSRCAHRTSPPGKLHLGRGERRGGFVNFSDQYRHPMWQKKRLEALEAAAFTCQECFSDETQLHVHHKKYVKGRMVWEYGLDELAVLCEPCHEGAHAMKDALIAVIGSVNPMWGPWREAAALVAGFYSGEEGIEERMPLQDVFEHAPLQFTVGVVASMLQWNGCGEQTREGIAKAVADLHAQPKQWEWLEKGLTHLKNVHGVMDGPISGDPK